MCLSKKNPQHKSHEIVQLVRQLTHWSHTLTSPRLYTGSGGDVIKEFNIGITGVTVQLVTHGFVWPAVLDEDPLKVSIPRHKKYFKNPAFKILLG